MDERYVNREIETDAESVGDTIRTVKRTKHVNYFDYSLLFVVIFLICFGCLMLYSASSFSSVIKFEDSTFYLKKHLLSVFLGTGALVFCTFFDYRLYKEKSIFITVAYWLSIFSLFLVKFSPLGMEYNGAKRWLNIGEFSIQPAEIVKITTILSIALVISNFSRELQSRKTMGIILVYTIVSAGGVTVLTQNLSSGIIIGFIGVSMLFISNRKYIIFGVISAVSVVLILIVMKFGASFRMGRIDAWLDPMGNSQEGGFQPAGDDYPGFRDVGDRCEVCVQVPGLPSVGHGVASGIDAGVLVRHVRDRSVRPSVVVVGIFNVVDETGEGVGGIQPQLRAQRLDLG